MVIMVGKPGSGKSTEAAQLKELGYTIINQDTLGNRHECLLKCVEVLDSGKDVVIDRTNINKSQRKYWIDLAKKYKITDITIKEFISSNDNCVNRILNRQSHPTIPNTTPTEKILEIVKKFEDSYEKPVFQEGFNSHYRIYLDNFPR